MPILIINYGNYKDYISKMYKLKQLQEDFEVEEINKTICKGKVNGSYAYFLMEKRNLTTITALKKLSAILGIPIKNFGFAGNKDKNAITKQHISILNAKKSSREKISGKVNETINLNYLGNFRNPISLGDLDGNKFIIVIRNITQQDIKKIREFPSSFMMPNYFGSQRFGTLNVEIGKCIVKKNFSRAAELIMNTRKDEKNNLGNYLKANKSDFIGAIRLITKKEALMYVHSYQSGIFNSVLFGILGSSEYPLDPVTKNIKIPIVGFGYNPEEYDSKISEETDNILKKENISPRDFIIKQLPELSSEGASRTSLSDVKDFQILSAGEDEMNPGMKKIKVEFMLSKGSYATVAVDFILNGCK